MEEVFHCITSILQILHGITCKIKASTQAYYSIFAYLHMAVETFFSGALPAQLARRWTGLCVSKYK
jgi:hypothetical protein